MTSRTETRLERRKRPSFSPQKSRSEVNTNAQQQKARSHSDSTVANTQSSLPDELQEYDTIQHPQTAALDFEEFSYFDDQGQLRRIGAKWLHVLTDYLHEHYQARSVSEWLPYLIVHCEDHVPPPSERPFKIAGLVAIWEVHGTEMYLNEIIFEDRGGSETDGPWVYLEDDLLDDLKPFVIPKAKTLSRIMHQHFPNALAVSYISHRIVVELEETSIEEYIKRLKSLPNAIAGTEVGLRYYNGLINGQEMKREKQPDPTHVDGDCDDIDYIQPQGCFYPGTMLSSKNDTAISAGILLQRQDDVRLTVAIHCWDKQLESQVDLGHADYTVKQGDWASGTVVGRVTERMGDSDIGLAKVNEPFSNRFLDLNGSAKTLLHTDDITNIHETFWIDSFVTGRQQLASLGVRALRAGQRGNGIFKAAGASSKDLPTAVSSITPKQGIYTTSTPEITGEPKIRAGICGAAVVRTPRKEIPRKAPSTSTGASGTSKTTSTPTSATPVLKPLPQEDTTGEVAGFIHWSDLQSLYSGRLLYFADAVNELIEDRWEVVQPVEKRSASSASLDDNSDPFVD